MSSLQSSWILRPLVHSAPALSAMSNPTSCERFLLWVDAVGGFLVCMGSEVRLGQAIPGGPAEIPLWGDLSRHQATLRRDEGGFWIEPVRHTEVAGRPVKESTLLIDGVEICLGTSVRMKFTRPSPLSSSARLDITSRHQTQPSVSGVLIMADTLILGSGLQSHIVCRNWTKSLVLFREGEKLVVRKEGSFEVDGKACRNRATLLPNSRIVSEECSISLEPIA